MLVRLLQFLCIIICFASCNLDDEMEPLVFKNKSNAHRVVLFERDGNLRSPGSMNISVLKNTDSLPDAPGNIFIAKSTEAVNAIMDTSSYVRWMNDSTLKIVYDKRLNVVKKETAANGVNIVYEFQ